MAGAAPSRSRLLFPDGRRGKGDLERAGQPWPSTASFCRPTAFGRRLSAGALCKGTSLFTRSVGSAPTAAGERGLRTAPVSPHREGVGRARPGPTGVAEPCPLMWGEAADHTPALPSQREKKKGGTTLLGKKRGRPIPLPRGEAVGAGRKGANGRHPWRGYRFGLLRRRGDNYLGCGSRRYCGRDSCLSQRRVLTLPQCF